MRNIARHACRVRANSMRTIPTITLFRQHDAWYARFSDPEVRHAFGSDTIPTAYRASAPTAQVFRAVSDLNPNALVEVRA